MELWIRSQDKEILMLINTIAIAKDEVGSIIGYGIDGKIKVELGTYATKERALEVLDEIQRTIAKNQSLISLMQNFTDLKGNEEGVAQIFKDMIYEMPEE